MLFDTIQLLDGSKLTNVVIESGSSFPPNPDIGEIFFNTVDSALYVFTAAGWTPTGTGGGGGVTTYTAGAGLSLSGTTFNIGGTSDRIISNTDTIDIAPTYAGQNSIDTLGTVTTGTWNAATIDIAHGGTGASSIAAGYVTSDSSALSSVSTIPASDISGNITGRAANVTGTVAIANGGTGKTSRQEAIDALVPPQAANTGKYLTTNGTTVSWNFPTGGTVQQVDISGGGTGLTTSGGPITTSGTITLGGVLSVANGGTGSTTIATAATALLPNQTNNAGKFLTSNGAGSLSWGSISSSNVTSALGFNPVNKAGDTLTGSLTLSADPTDSMHAVTKRYVDTIASNINIHDAARTATTSDLSATYSNGSGGVGATLSGTSASNTLAIGGITVSVGDRVLVKDQTAILQNGIYEVTNVTDPVTGWVLTRAADYDGHVAGAVDAGDMVFVQEGDLAGTLWVQNTAGTITVGASDISWTQFGGAGTYSAGSGISISSNVISNTGVRSLTAGSNISLSSSTGAVTVGITGAIPIANGGTGATTAAAALAALAGGTTADRVLKANGTSISLSQIDLSSDTVTSTLPIARGGTGATTAAAAINALVPSQTNQSGKFLSTDGTNLEWIGVSVQGTGGALQFNNGGQFDGTAEISYSGSNTLTIGTSGSTFNLIGALGSTSTIFAGGESQGEQLETNLAGHAVISGGAAKIAISYNPITNEVTNVTSSGSGGHVYLKGGLSDSRWGGSVIIQTAASTSLVSRLEIDRTGGWKINGAYGTSGQVFMSNGAETPPSWQTAPFTGTVTSVALSGGTTGLTTSGGPVTTSGTLTLAGTLAVANGGTGATTATAALNALLPAQTGESGKFLTTDGSTSSWAAVAGGGTVTSVNVSGGSTGLTFSGGPVTLSGTITLGGTLSIAAGGTGVSSFSAGYVKSNGTALVSSTTVAGADVLGNIPGSADNVTGVVTIAHGGTGATTAAAAATAILPSQAGQSGRYLKSNGTVASWSTVDSIDAAGSDTEIQFNDGGVIGATPAVKIVSEVFTAANNISVNSITVGRGSGTGPLVNQLPTYNFNTAIGDAALAGSNYSTRNTAVGYHTLQTVVNASNNTAIGADSLSSLLYGAGNTAVGAGALALSDVGSYNVAVGVDTLSENTGGSYNTAIGSNALKLIDDVSYNTAVGYDSQRSATSGGSNTSVGANTLPNVATGSNNSAVGTGALYSTYGSSNTAVGKDALYSATSGSNNTAIGTGAGSSITNGSNNTIIGAITGTTALANTIIIGAGATERVRVNENGAVSLSEGGYGTSGQVLVSNGDTGAPSWQTPPSGTVSSVELSGGTTGLTVSGSSSQTITSAGTFTLAGTLAVANGGTGATTAAGAITALLPAQSGQSGKYLSSNGSSAAWTTISIAGSALTGTSLASNIVSSSLTSLGTLAGLTMTGTLQGVDGGLTGSGGLTIRAGTLSSGTAGPLAIAGGDAQSGSAAGAVTISGGASTAGQGGAVTISGGTGVASSGIGGDLILAGGAGGSGGIGGGAVVIKTGSIASTTERLRIVDSGAWSVGSAGNNFGTSGQILTSNGSDAAPTWQNVAGGSVTSIEVSGGGTGLTFSGGPVTSSGTITMGGTLAVAAGGTGATTAAGAAAAILPSQGGNSGKFLTTDGSTVSWTTSSASFSGGAIPGSVAFGASYDEYRADVTATATTTLNCALSNVFNITLAANITTLAFSNIPASGRVYSMSLFLNQDATGSRTIAWPASVRWSGGTAPTLTTTAGKTDIVSLVTHDGGTNWFGFIAGQNF
jgi:hypothetical protein